MLRSRTIGLAAAIALLAASLFAGGAAATGTRGMHLTVPSFSFTDFLGCDGYVCTATADGLATSNIDGDGTIHWDLVTTFFDGWDSPCNHVDEVGTFTFAHGTITEVSSHTDCRLNGQRVHTTFRIVGGTGRYAGASGGGLETAGPQPFTYNGTISY